MSETRGMQSTEAKFLAGLLRGIRDDLMNYAMPALTTDAAKEHLQFAHLTLDRYCADLDAAQLAGQPMLERYAELLIEGAQLPGVETAAARSEEGLSELRARLAASIAQFSGLANAGQDHTLAGNQWLHQVLALESRWQALKGAAQAAGRYQAPVHQSHDSAPGMQLPTLAAYLQRRSSRLLAPQVMNLRVLPGGRSKRTIFVTFAPNEEWPCEVVIRQDMPDGAVDTADGTTSVVREFPVLDALGDKGLPIARTLLLEANNSECGAPFMMVERLAGAAPGTFMGFFEPRAVATRSIVEDLARVLARIHRIDLSELRLPDDLSMKPEDRLRREIEYRSNKWRRDGVEPSPIMECALARLRAECQPGLAGPALVHGDVMAHNLLVADGKIQALLDWEFVHVGDPAQDLAYCRTSVEQVMPWPEFMSLYTAAGGLPISEKRLAIFGLVGLVRNCSFAATFARQYLNDPGGDVTGAAAGYFSIPMLEAQMLPLLNRLAVD